MWVDGNCLPDDISQAFPLCTLGINFVYWINLFDMGARLNTYPILACVHSHIFFRLWRHCGAWLHCFKNFAGFQDDLLGDGDDLVVWWAAITTLKKDESSFDLMLHGKRKILVKDSLIHSSYLKSKSRGRMYSWSVYLELLFNLAFRKSSFQVFVCCKFLIRSMWTYNWLILCWYRVTTH